uniref:CKLF like MARVEL transmembrane domain containing 3 n=1 Tax=Falco tinnunculus TaxID=100819 RepID=A0A8C4TYN6_FALTI
MRKFIWPKGKKKSWKQDMPSPAALTGTRRENNVLSFIIFICYIASLAASFMMAPLLEFLLALFLFFAYASKLNEKFKGLYWPLTDFLRCVTAAIIYFAISIAAVSKYNDGASKAAGVSRCDQRGRQPGELLRTPLELQGSPLRNELWCS